MLENASPVMIRDWAIVDSKTGFRQIQALREIRLRKVMNMIHPES
jgi:hypothetical protein